MGAVVPRMSRVWMFALLLGCAHGVSRPNEVPPPAKRADPYVGRIVLSTYALRDHVDDFKDTWTRRLAILGAGAHVTYDDTRAVFDVYGTANLEQTAKVLTDSGTWRLDDRELDGFVIAWLPPTASCGCSARVRVSLPSAWLCEMIDGVHMLSRDGRTTALLGKVRWMARSIDKKTVVEVERPSSYEKCPTEDLYPASVMFALPPDLSPEEQTRVALGLGGGTLPEIPRIVSVTR